ncbi:Wzt carbohydrate-binding domain-containing protein [Ferrovibrio sp.]|uniref:Wzt carbohydrate-binding domain-containing protein n=1 Tax=Ferrovibrio sp. TaxID=1917215 RepID=UPI003D0BD70B
MQYFDPLSHKILICATPKTGNTWLKFLLSDLYELSLVALPNESDIAPLLIAKKSIAHCHILPTRALADTLLVHDILPVTVLRHPKDVLLSLYHFVRSKQKSSHKEEDLLHAAEGDGAAELLDYVRSYFMKNLLISKAWMDFGAPVVRYEDLLRNPIASLRQLTGRISPVNNQMLRFAAVNNQFAYLKSDAVNEDSNFFRAGTSGLSRNTLPEAVHAELDLPIWQEVFAALGYGRDPEVISQPDLSAHDPFRGHTAFDNGMRISRNLRHVLLRELPHLAQRWPEPWRTDGPDTLYTWLNEVAPQPSGGRSGVTNLMRLIHQNRQDLHEAYGNIDEIDAFEYGSWFIIYGPEEYSLPPSLITPVAANLIRRDQQNPIQLSVSNFSFMGLTGEDGEAEASFCPGAAATLTLRVTFQQACRPCFGFSIRKSDDRTIYALNTRMQGMEFSAKNAGDVVELQIPLKLNLFPGRYFITLSLLNDENENLELIERLSKVIDFSVEATIETGSFGNGDSNCLARFIPMETPAPAETPA